MSKNPPPPKRPPNCPDFMRFGYKEPQPKNGLYVGLRGSNIRSDGTSSTRKPPTFVVSTPENCPTQYQRMRGLARAARSQHDIPQSRCLTIAMPKRVQFARAGPVCLSKKPPKALQMCRFETKTGQKGVKTCVSKVIADPWGMPKQLLWGCFESALTRFGLRSQNRPFWNQKLGRKRGSGAFFPTRAPRPLGVLR